MQSDRELLELAAKAAGIDHRRLPDAWPERFDDDQWNPLTDDGDALRLAVKLQIDIRQFLQYRGVVDALVDRLGFGRGEAVDNDPYGATRRAVVRAAAEIAVRAHPDHKDGAANG